MAEAARRKAAKENSGHQIADEEICTFSRVLQGGMSAVLIDTKRQLMRGRVGVMQKRDEFNYGPQAIGATPDDRAGHLTITRIDGDWILHDQRERSVDADVLATATHRARQRV